VKDREVEAEHPVAVQNETSVVAFLDGLRTRPTIDPNLAARLEELRAVLTGDGDDDGTFLTVLLRTQGRRLEGFKDSLLCLAAQTCQNFELIVLVHNADAEASDEVDRIVGRQIPSFARRINVVHLAGGGRATPLNVGVAQARGRYVAAYDDDDLLFAHWVEAFREASQTANGRMLRAIVATQGVSPEMWPYDEAGFRSTTWPHADYAKSFDQLDHLVVNHSPFMSWAFPRSLFQTVGVRFDEELDVCEDWDVILQGSLLLGVQSIDSLTSIYRRWDGGKSSYTEHSEAEWRTSEHRVIDRLNRSVLLFPPGTVDRVRGQLMSRPSESFEAELRDIYGSRSWRLIRAVRRALAPLRRTAGRTLRFLRLR
jgi:Glycosyl transferase family 2